MKIKLVPSAIGSDSHHQFMTSYLINDVVAIDAGGVGFFGLPQSQARIQHVFISHTHIDHIASLPIFVENAYEGKSDCVTVHGNAEVLDCLQRDIFNGRVWPDFIALSRTQTPFLKLSCLDERKPVTVAGLTITPISVDHVVSTFGFIIDDGQVAVAIPSDTGPTEEFWHVVNQTPNVRAVFLEAAFPNSMLWLARISKHLTPSQFGEEMRKVHADIPFIAIHIKVRYHAEVVAELVALNNPNVWVGDSGRDYYFTH